MFIQIFIEIPSLNLNSVLRNFSQAILWEKIIKNDQVHTYISNCLPLKPSVACNQQNP